MATPASDWPAMAVPSRVEALRRVSVNFTERFSLTGTSISRLESPSDLPLVRQTEFLIPLVGILIMAGMAIRDGPLSPRNVVLAVLGRQVFVTVVGMRSKLVI